MTSAKYDTKKIHRNLKVAEALFNMAYSTKRYQLSRKHPDWTDLQIHNKVIEIIDRGCQ